MKVTVKPVPKESWHKKDGKESFARPQSIEVLYDLEKGGYATGLTSEETEKYGKILGVDLSSTYDMENPHPFWGSQAGKIKLPNHTMLFDTDRPGDFVKVKNLKASSRVANSLKEWEDGLWPKATHYIFDESEEVEIKATKVQQKNKCIARMSALTKDEKLSVIQILSNKSFRDRSDNFIEVELDSIISTPEGVRDFMELTRKSKEQVYAEGVIREAIYKHKLTKEGHKILYMGDMIGNDVNDAVDYFLSPDNQVFKVKLLEVLSS